MIINDKVQIRVNTKNFEHFKNLHYEFKIGDVICVKPTELMNNSKIPINVKCDVCGSITEIEYRSYLKNIKKYPLYCCSVSCAKIKETQTKKEIYGDEYEKMRVDKMRKTNKERYGNENSSQIFRNEKEKDFFIKQLRDIYKNDNFEYSELKYINNYTKVQIICSIHGIFSIRPIELMKGQGCKKCNRDKEKETILKKYIEKSSEIHNFKYDYSKIIFEKLLNKVTIVCPIHGDFEQTLSEHSKGKGCQKCGNIKIRLKTIERINSNLLNGHQITPSYNKKACKIFDEISERENVHIQHAMNGGEFYIKDLGYWVDGYDQLNNVVYEYDEKSHFKNGKLLDKDIKRQNEIINCINCKFVRIKYND